MCDSRRDLKGGHKFWGSKSILQSKVLVRQVPQILTVDQKRTGLDISRYLLSRYEDDPCDFIEQDETKDETWVHHFDSESKLQSKNGSTPAPLS